MPALLASNTPSKTQSFREFLAESPRKNDPSGDRNPSPAEAAKRAPNRPPENLAGDGDDHNPDLGPFLLKMARDTIHSGHDPNKALGYAIRASGHFERALGPGSDLATCLHVIAAIQSGLGRFDEAVEALERSILMLNGENGLGHDSGSGHVQGSGHEMVKFAGLMQLGDTYSMIGQVDRSILCYESGLKIQMEALGKSDPRVAETCRYLAEAHVQAMQFDEAENFCKRTLEIHREHCSPASLTEAADRRLMALIFEAKGDYEPALEHLVLASMSMIAHGQDNEVAAIDVSIGDIYLSLCRFDEAVFAYQKALTVFKSTKGENHSSVALVYIRLADLYYKTGKLRESKSYCENALRIYSKPMHGTTSGEIASGLTEISTIYEALNEPEEALKLLQKAVKLLENIPGQYRTVAGIEAQMGVMFYMVGRYMEARKSFESAITKLRASGERKSAFFGFVLNQMGLACVQLFKIGEAAAHFEEAREILEQECGTYHLDTLGVYSNLAATYDAMGRVEDAIEILEYILKMREEKLGTANPDVDDEKKRLFELLKEAGRVRNRKGKSLENLIESNSLKMKKEGKKKKWGAFGLRT